MAGQGTMGGHRPNTGLLKCDIATRTCSQAAPPTTPPKAKKTRGGKKQAEMKKMPVAMAKVPVLGL